MRSAHWIVALTSLMLGAVPPVHGEDPDGRTDSVRDSQAAERTRTKLLKQKVTVAFMNVPLRDVLKEFAAQVEMQAERPVMWTYANGVPPAHPVTYACKDKPLDQALKEVLRTNKLGYTILSQDDQPRDGWVRVGNPGEAENATGPGPDAVAQKKAAATLAIAKSLIEQGKKPDAKAVLMLVARKYPGSKAAAEARELLENLDK